jgi:hypothetical protein
MLFFSGREEQESRQDCAAEVHALQGDLRGRVGTHVPRPERPFTQHLHARREQIGEVHTYYSTTYVLIMWAAFSFFSYWNAPKMFHLNSILRLQCLF